MRELTQRVRTATVAGKKALIVDYEVPEDAPHALREGLARRAITNGGDPCPCGARVVVPNRAMRRAGVTVVPVRHENDCPAADAVLVPVLRRWMRGRDD